MGERGGGGGSIENGLKVEMMKIWSEWWGFCQANEDLAVAVADVINILLK